MSKGQIGASKSDKAWAQVERDLRDIKKSGEFNSRKNKPVTLAEQIKHNEYLETFEGKYESFGAWERELTEELSRLGLNGSLLGEVGIYSRIYKADGWEKNILPREYAIELKKRSGF